jgi:hypothetical protein
LRRVKFVFIKGLDGSLKFHQEAALLHVQSCFLNLIF